MPLPASLFASRGRSSSVMDQLDDAVNNTLPAEMGIWTGSQGTAQDYELDDNGAPMYTPPVTGAGFGHHQRHQIGPHGLFLGDAFDDAFATSTSQAHEHQQPHQHTHAQQQHQQDVSSMYISNVSSASMYHPLNPRAHLLRRTSSTSTLGSTGDEEEIEWSQDDLDRLKTVYDACVEEASFETPFSGIPPSQLLHAIARAVKREYPSEWRHSITQTRSKALQMAKETERRERARARADDSEDERARGLDGLGAEGASSSWRASYGALMMPRISERTPKAIDENDADATPRRRRLRRNDSMDFLPYKRNMESLARLSSKLNQTGEDGPVIFHQPGYGITSRPRTETASAGSDAFYPPHSAPLHGRLSRSMTFTSPSVAGSEEDAQIPMHELTINSKSPSPKKDRSRIIYHSDDSYDMLYPTGPLSARPASKLGYGFQQAQQHGLMHSLYHAPSMASLNSSTGSTLSSVSSSNDSVEDDTDPFAQSNMSIYGSSVASDVTTRSNGSGSTGCSTPGPMKRSFDTANEDNGCDYSSTRLGTTTSNAFGSSSATSLASMSDCTNAANVSGDFEAITPHPHTDESSAVLRQQERDYSSAPFTTLGGPAVLRADQVAAGPTYPSSNSHPAKKKGPQKPALQKSHTFDALSTSPSKYMRLEQEGWLLAPPRLPTAGTGLSLDSPFEEHFTHRA